MQPDFVQPVEPDEFGIMDGREVARALIARAFSLIVPYAAVVRVHPDMLLQAITDETVTDLHHEAQREGGLPCDVITIHDPGSRRRQFHMGHLEVSRHETLRLLRKLVERMKALPSINEPDQLGGQ